SFRPERLVHVVEAGMQGPGREAWRRLSGIFVIDPDGQVRFKRPVLCEVAYEGLPFRVRRQLHAAVGKALEADLGNDVDADPAVLSLHFSRASDYGRAWKYALMGAERAASRFAHADAATLYRRALAAGRDADATSVELAFAWEALGEALVLVGELAAAGDAFTSARRLIRDEPVAQARLCFRHG